MGNVFTKKPLPRELYWTLYCSEEEKGEWWREFKKHSKGGRLPREAIETALRSVYPKGDPEQFALYLFNAMDMDNDNFISFNDFMQSISILSKGPLHQKTEWYFKLYDVDKNKRITEQDMNDLLSAISKTVEEHMTTKMESPASRISKIFSFMDEERKGFVSLDNFYTCLALHKWLGVALGWNLLSTWNRTSFLSSATQDLPGKTPQ